MLNGYRNWVHNKEIWKIVSFDCVHGYRYYAAIFVYGSLVKDGPVYDLYSHKLNDEWTNIYKYRHNLVHESKFL